MYGELTESGRFECRTVTYTRGRIAIAIPGFP